MARVFTPTDAHATMNLLYKELTGQDSTIQVVDTSTFSSVGEQILSSYPMENVINSLGIVLGRTLVASRPYNAKLQIIQALNSGMYTNRFRKISIYSKMSEASGYFNTDLHTNLKDGYDNGVNGSGTTGSVGNMWEQRPSYAMELNFGGSKVYDVAQTIYRDQLKIAFRTESEFGQFVSGIMTERSNDMETLKEGKNRAALLNHMAGVYSLTNNMKGSVINLTAAYNERFGTDYTSAELRSTYLDSFLKFFVSTFKLTSDYLTNRTSNYHWSPPKTVGGEDLVLLRHTPKNKQKAVLYSPLFTEANAWVMPEIFNPSYLDVKNYEGVTFWQNFNDPAAIKVKAAIPDVTGQGGQTSTQNVSIPYVVGMIFDTDAIMTDYQLDDVLTSPLEARKGFYNMWWHVAFNNISDFTENSVLFVMEDPVA